MNVPTNGPPAPNGNHNLAPVDLQALLEAVRKLLLDSRNMRTVGEILDAYLADAVGQISARVLDERRRHFARVDAEFRGRLVIDCTPFELKQWICRQYPGSGWTRSGVNAGIQRAFNWAVRMRLIRENTFHGLTFAGEEKKHGRDMKPEELRLLMRASDPHFRRFLLMLKFTGARPAELARLRWENIDWQLGIATLKEHKTGRKTGRPRVIIFPPAGMKLLGWIKRNWHGTAPAELRRLLLGCPGHEAPARDVASCMAALGFSYRQVYQARKLLGAKHYRRGGWGEHGYTTYALPEGAPEPVPAAAGHVFVCTKAMWPWTRTALGTKFKRLRKLLDLPADCKLYGLRHFFITEGVRRHTNLKALATLVGHSTTAMIERVYCHLENDIGFLRNAVLTATGQPAAVWDTQEPLAASDRVRLDGPTFRARRRPSRRYQVRFRDSHKVCYEAACWAVQQDPALTGATDQQIFVWLHKRPEWRDQLPPTAISFTRYLRYARRFLEGTSKRKQRRQRMPIVGKSNSAAPAASAGRPGPTDGKGGAS